MRGFCLRSGRQDAARRIPSSPRRSQPAIASCVSECIAKEILTNDHGRATGVAYFDSDARLQEQTADLVVVSCSATESARLLLNSKSRLFPNGLGNRYDWVGRNLQGHAYTGAAGLFDHETYDDLGPGRIHRASATTTTAIRD